jgi:tRNA-uridine 2-sulfurtransferase
MPLAIALCSGGLDSMLAVRILQRQDFEVEGLHVRTWYQCCQTDAALAAAQLGIRLSVVGAGEDYAEVIRRPRFGYGRGANPCVDCRIYMCRIAKRRMDDASAELVVTGEVVGQRPMSQKRRDLDVIEHHSGLEGRLLRPLSAQLLRPTIAEEQGLVDRRGLYAFCGRARGGLMQLAAELGIERRPPSSSGCALVHPPFAKRVRELIQLRPHAPRWAFDLLRFGHYRWLDASVKLVLGRNEAENGRLASLARSQPGAEWVLLEPDNFQGPTALVVGPQTPSRLAAAAAEIARRSHRVPGGARLLVAEAAGSHPVELAVLTADEAAKK